LSGPFPGETTPLVTPARLQANVHPVVLVSDASAIQAEQH
jgi:hypothetical protein